MGLVRLYKMNHDGPLELIGVEANLDKRNAGSLGCGYMIDIRLLHSRYESGTNEVFTTYYAR